MATYKYNTLATAKVEWIGGNGKTLAVTAALKQECWDVFGGTNYEPKSLYVTMTPSVDGRAEHDDFITLLPGRPDGVIAKIGSIGMRQPILDQINAALASVHSHSAWQAKLAAEQQAARIQAEYDATTQAVDRMMTLNGTTY